MKQGGLARKVSGSSCVPFLSRKQYGWERTRGNLPVCAGSACWAWVLVFPSFFPKMSQVILSPGRVTVYLLFKSLSSSQQSSGL